MTRTFRSHHMTVYFIELKQYFFQYVLRGKNMDCFSQGHLQPTLQIFLHTLDSPTLPTDFWYKARTEYRNGRE